MKIINEIKNYTEFLRQSCSLAVSFHLKKEYRPSLNTTPLFVFNSHTSPYCIKVKQNPKNLRKCLLCQARTVKKCSQTPSFTGSCHADVCQYIQGIYLRGEAVGFISVSGYRAKTPRTAKNLQDTRLYNASTKELSPDEKYLDSVISPLRNMLEIYLSGYNADKNSSGKEYLRILDYINENYRNITLGKLCNKFSYSKSHISHIFKANNGKSIRRYANALKIRDAKELLKTTELSMTEIALMTGFNDISYFVHVFKDITGTTPTKYRKN